MKNIYMSFVMVAAFIFSGCTVDDAEFHRVLEDEGYTNIQNEGYEWFSCSDSDHFQSGFTATRVMPNGDTRTVHGAVCCGWLKDCTIRH